jgi:hypothetical protein
MIARALSREARLRRARVRLDADIRSSRALVVGPFLGEVGYELLYWRPYVLRLLRSHRVDPARVTVVGRGGSGAWYAEYAGNAVDAFDLMPPDDVRQGGEVRMLRTGQRKQVDVDELDRELLHRAAPEAAPIHPLHMFWSWRFTWEGLRPPGETAGAGDFDPLPRGEVPAAVAERLPPHFVAVKAYFNDCVPADNASRTRYAALVRRLAQDLPVVLLQPGFAADDHSDWSDGGEAVVRIDDALRPETNLAVQAAVVARSVALVSTYGGFCYLGPFLDLPTASVGDVRGENPYHEHVLRAVRPRATYDRFALADSDGVAGFVGEAAGRVRP